MGPEYLYFLISVSNDYDEQPDLETSGLIQLQDDSYNGLLDRHYYMFYYF